MEGLLAKIFHVTNTHAVTNVKQPKAFLNKMLFNLTAQETLLRDQTMDQI